MAKQTNELKLLSYFLIDELILRAKRVKTGFSFSGKQGVKYRAQKE